MCENCTWFGQPIMEVLITMEWGDHATATLSTSVYTHKEAKKGDAVTVMSLIITAETYKQ